MNLANNPAIHGAALALTEEWIHRVHGLQTKEGAPVNNAPTARARDGVAIIPIQGPLSKEPSIWSWIFGGCDYQTIAKDINAATESPEIHSIILDVDSPGGEVSGCDELSALIDAASRKKKVVAYAGGMCASAAYWLASAANEIVADPCAILGSIGVRATLVDTSKAEEMAGVAVYDIVSDQSPLKAVDPSKESDRARVKDTLTQLASVFIGRVAKNRGVTSETVKSNYGRGGVMTGSAALKAGLSDRFGNFESLLSELSGVTMKTQNNPAAAHASVKSGKCSSCRADMEDDDQMYCKGCYGSSASADVAPLFALTGKADVGEALAVVAAWKEQAGESAALKSQLEEQRRAAEAAAFDAEIAAAKSSGLLAKSDDHKRNKAALTFKSKPNALNELRTFLAAFDPLSAPSAHTGSPAIAPAADKPAVATGLTAEEERLIKKLGLTAEKYLAQKAVLKQPRVVEEEN